jgi:hypothetical protein
MYDHLVNGRELAPSQVVRTMPRGTQDGKVPPLSAENLPGISQTPDENDLVLFEEQQSISIAWSHCGMDRRISSS